MFTNLAKRLETLKHSQSKLHYQLPKKIVILIVTIGSGYSIFLKGNVIDHFLVASSLCLKARLSSKP